MKNAWLTMCPHPKKNHKSSSLPNNSKVLSWSAFPKTKTFFHNFNNIICFCAREWKSVYIYIHNTHSILVIINDVCQKKMRIFSRSIFYTSESLSSDEIPVMLRSGCLPNKLFILLNEFSKQMRGKLLCTKLEENPVSNRENINVWFAFLNIE